jgi:hypothetical protein
MKLTNRLNLPQPLVDAVKNDGYSSGGADISVTTLLKPPRMVALEKQHKDEIEEDVSTRIWSLMGQVVHGILERASNTGVAERRLSINVEGWSVSGSMDRYIDGLLQDYKVVTAYKFKDGGVPIEYEQQLNVYAEILQQHGHPVNRMEIVGILRDWSKLEARRDANYPQTQVIVRQVPFWTREITQKFIRERVILHKQARITLPECSDEDRWARPTKYAVMREGQARAVKLFDVQSEAKDYANQGKNLKVETRPGELVRCANYCNVAPFCDQFKKEVKDEVDGRNQPVAKPAGSLRSAGKAS